jgi:hypothetical protein
LFALGQARAGLIEALHDQLIWTRELPARDGRLTNATSLGGDAAGLPNRAHHCKALKWSSESSGERAGFRCAAGRDYQGHVYGQVNHRLRTAAVRRGSMRRIIPLCSVHASLRSNKE